jgi:Cys/Met metabolism PLP-dependent enzyme
MICARYTAVFCRLLRDDLHLTVLNEFFPPGARKWLLQRGVSDPARRASGRGATAGSARCPARRATLGQWKRGIPRVPTPVSWVRSSRGWSRRDEIGRRVRPSTFRRGRRRTLCSAGNAHIRATTGHRVGTPWRRSSAGSRGARHPEVLITRYPGLPTHPTHDAARRQLKGFGTIISFDVRGGTAAADAVCARLRLIQHATSLGRSGIHDGAPRQRSGAGAPAAIASAIERRHRGGRGPLG